MGSITAPIIWVLLALIQWSHPFKHKEDTKEQIKVWGSEATEAINFVEVTPQDQGHIEEIESDDEDTLPQSLQEQSAFQVWGRGTNKKKNFSEIQEIRLLGQDFRLQSQDHNRNC